MTTDRRRRTDQPYSRFSRINRDEILPPPPPEEPSLTDIAMRVLGEHIEPPRRAFSRDDDWHQPPPPDPEPQWPSEPEPSRHSRPPSPPHQMQRAAAPARSEDDDEFPPAPRYREAPPARPGPARQDHPETDGPGAKAPPSGKAAPPTPKGPGLFARTLTAARVKAGPALVNGAFWLARNLRRREIRKRYSRALVFGHTRIADRTLEKLFFVPTLKGATIDPAPERGIHYDGPVPRAVFNWIMAAMPGDLRRFAFIDVHAGRGRTALLAAKWQFDRIHAYEYDPEIFDDLQMNVAQYPRSLMACRKFDCFRGDIDGIRLPVQDCIIYFSGAWREQMIPGVMNYVRDTFRQSPRRIYVVLENVDDEAALADDGIFQRIEPPLKERIKLKLLSPLDVRIYASKV